MQLVKYDAMCQAIVSCYSCDEVKELRDKAIALEAYAKQAQNAEAERQACAVRLRAERRCGELLAEKERVPVSKRNPDKRVSDQGEPIPSEYQQAKKSAGISDTQAKRWQGLARVPSKEFESALASDEKPSTTGIIKKMNGSSTNIDPGAMRLWGRLRDMEAMKLYEMDFDYLTGEMTQAQYDDLRRIVPALIDQLTRLNEVIN